jgi:hypothetical protein
MIEPEHGPTAFRVRELLLTIGAPATILLAIILPRLHGYDLGLNSMEGALILGATMTLGVVVGTLTLLRRETFVPAVNAVLLLGFALTTGLVPLVAPLTSVTGVPAGFFVAGAVLSIGYLSWSLRANLPLIVTVTFGAFLLATLVAPRPIEASGEKGSLPAAATNRAPIVHIILDEHIGLAGFPEDLPGSTSAKNGAMEVYKDFALYSHAYSQYPHTELSLAATFNGKTGIEVQHLVERRGSTWDLSENLWFERLKEAGFSVKVYQSRYLDLCGERDAVDACYTYSIYSSHVLRRFGFDLITRAKIITRKLFGGDFQFGPFASMEVIDRFKEDIAENPQGTAFILHLLIPHWPHVFRDDCSVRDPKEWGFIGERSQPVMNTPRQREENYGVYFEQLACTSRRLSEIFLHLKELGIYDEATIIVHGDHGSRIGESRYHDVQASELSERDLVDHFSTLLAVKGPGVSPGVRSDSVSLQDFFARRFLGHLGEPGSENKVWVQELPGEFGSRILRWPDQPSVQGSR